VSNSQLQVLPYDPSWVNEFEAEAARVRSTLGSVALRIDHNGSTSVPGLAAKPVIDIQISVASLSPMDAYRLPLQAIGYTHIPHSDDAFYPFFHRPAQWPHAHHIHVVVSGGDEERRTLAFRDYLRDHADVAREYEAIKVGLATAADASDGVSREAYARGKTSFIERTVAAALAGGYPTALRHDTD
jgi:GrpB-like predicted nucleotidyltransferase (UPF0157 family)